MWVLMAGKQWTLFDYLGQTLSAKQPRQQQEENQEVVSDFASRNNRIVLF